MVDAFSVPFILSWYHGMVIKNEKTDSPRQFSATDVIKKGFLLTGTTTKYKVCYMKRETANLRRIKIPSNCVVD